MEIEILATGSKGNCYKVSDGESTILLDAGIPFKEIQAKCHYQTSDILAAFVTHRHGDHAKAIKDLLLRGIPVYGNADLHDYNQNVKILEKFCWQSVGSYDIVSADVKHDVECYCYFLHSRVTDETLLYITDAAECRYKFPKANYLLVEANYSEDGIKDEMVSSVALRVRQTHMSIETLLEFLRTSDLSELRQVYLIHLSSTHSNANEFKRRVEQLTGVEVITI